jgi:hypothetical protein
LTYSELAELAAETVRNPSVYADLHHAAGAASDLASIKFGVREISDKLADYADDKLTEHGEIHTAVIAIVYELDGLLGESRL